MLTIFFNYKIARKLKMNTGQMLITMGVIILLSTIILRVNASNLANETQYGVLATSDVIRIVNSNDL